MTSKHCFSKVMRENFRHKTWMLALSLLGNLLALPVAFLMSTEGGSGYAGSGVNMENLTYQVRRIEEFFYSTMCVTGGVVAIAGALIVGLFGFRYVFHRNMVDTYHSMPVKRRTLFTTGWLNGFLIWFLPFLANLTATVILGESRLGKLRKAAAALPGLGAADREVMTGWLTGGGLILNALLSTLALVIAFLLVYHLVLLAAMLCGNVLNTLVAIAVIGAGAVSVYGMLYLFQGSYLDTFLYEAYNYFDKVFYASPFISSIYVLYRRVADMQAMEYSGLAGVLILNLLIAAVLGILALTAYLKRSSELAEQGIAWKPVKFVFQTVASVLAAMGGWLLFQSLATEVTEKNGTYAWGVFGGLLGGIVVFGVLDIIFHMDFKAFFRHKILMAGVMAVSLLVCFGFAFDWMHYDTYLPDKEDIAEIALYDSNCGNTNYYYLDFEDERYPLNRMHITDVDAAYDFLTAAVDFEENGFPEEEAVSGRGYRSESVAVKVTLKNGKSYYRYYHISEQNTASAYALMTSPQYMEVMFYVSEEDVRTATMMNVNRNGEAQVVLRAAEQEEKEMLTALCEAYNKDVRENPEALVSGNGRILCTLNLRREDGPDTRSRYMEVSEEMTNTIAAMKQLGLGEYAEVVSADEVQEITLDTYYYRSDLYAGVNLVEYVCEMYGVYPESLDIDSYVYDESDLPRAVDYETIEKWGVNGEGTIGLSLTDREDIEELLELISYSDYRNYSIYHPELAGNITLVMKNGKKYEVRIPYGALPEKYILKFAEMQKELLQQ